MTSADAATRTRQRMFEGPFGAVYSFYRERRWLSRAIATFVWASDIRPEWRSLSLIADVPDGATVVDAPCGAGIAFRALPPDKDVRYLAYDLSPAMLARARRRAHALGLRQIEVAEADAEALPVEDSTADLFLSMFGLHCFARPEAAVLEIARCLRPGGGVIGSSIVRGDRRLDRFRVRPGKGAYGPVGTAADLRGWLRGAGLDAVTVDQRGVFAYFRARKPG